ncbi:MAG: hypothetical protein U9N51_07990 [Bacteroidota bacterium]|nr:hypothetical protein [Bacteroidota bacterium]
MSIEMIFKLLAPIAIGIIFLIALIGVMFFKRVSGDLKIIIIYFWTVAVMELSSLFIAGDNLLFMPLSAIVDLTLLSVLYLRYMLLRGKYQYILIGLVGIGIVFVFLDLIQVINDPMGHVFYGAISASLIIILFSIIYFIQSALFIKVKVSDKRLSINVLFFVLYNINLLFILSINFLISENVDLVSYFWIIRLFINITINIGLGYLIWKHGRTPKISQSA